MRFKHVTGRVIAVETEAGIAHCKGSPHWGEDA